MRINELNKQQLSSLLNELYGLAGAKEVFKKFNVEMINEETEKQGLNKLLNGIKDLLKTSKVVKEYLQATQFLDMQIKTNEEMLKTAEGFMKTMVEGMLNSFKASKQLATETQSKAFIEEAKPLLDNILNEEDKKKAEEYLCNLKLGMEKENLELLSSLELSINSRYRDKEKEADSKVEETMPEEDKKEVAKEKKANIKKSKEEPKQKSIEEEIDDMDMSELDDIVEEEKPKEKVEEKEEIETYIDVDAEFGKLVEDESNDESIDTTELDEDNDINKEIEEMDFSDLDGDLSDDEDPLLGDNTEIDFM